MKIKYITLAKADPHIGENLVRADRSCTLEEAEGVGIIATFAPTGVQRIYPWANIVLVELEPPPPKPEPKTKPKPAGA